MSRVRKRKKSADIVDITEDFRVERKKRVDIVPRNSAQEEYLINLSDHDKRIIVAVGPAGTGKTHMAVLQAIKDYKMGLVERFIITRPTVTVDDEKFGFLPGDLNTKMEPWLAPIFDVFEEFYSPAEIKFMLQEKVIEITPFAFLRGRTFKNAVIIADETQNTTPIQMKTLLTRIGNNTRIFVTGDIKQTDRKQENGLADFISRADTSYYKNIAVCTFGREHVERDYIVSDILEIYGDDD